MNLIGFLIFIICFFNIGISLSFPQHSSVTDSLYTSYRKARHDTERAQILMKIGESLHLNYSDSAIHVWQMARTIAEDALTRKGHYSPDDPLTRKFLELRAATLYNIGYKLTEKGDVFSGTGYFEKSLELWEQILPVSDSSAAFDINRAIAFTISNLGMLYGQLGDIQKELEYYNKSLLLAEKNNDTMGIGGAMNNLGTVYYEQGDNQKAMKYFHKSLKLREQINDKDGTAASLTNLGSAYGKTGGYEKELEFHHRAFRIWEEMGDKRGMAYALNNIGNVYRQRGNLPKTLEFFQKCMMLREETGDKKNLAYSLSNTGTVYFDLGDLERADDFGMKALQVSRELGSPANIMEAANLLKKIYTHQKKWEKAMEMFELSIQMRDSIQNEENRKAAMRQQFKYEWEKKEHELKSEHEKKEAIADLESHRQKIAIGFVISCFLFAVIIAILINSNLKKSKKVNFIITQQKEEIAEQKQNIVDSIEYARYIQKSMLPADEEFKKLFPDSFILFRPRDIVSGDFYWVASPPSNPPVGGKGNIPPPTWEDRRGAILLATADCTGHGVPGAFMSMLCTALLNEAVINKGITKPNEIFKDVRKGIIAALKQNTGQTASGDPTGKVLTKDVLPSVVSTKDGMDATIILLVFGNVETRHPDVTVRTSVSSLRATCANNPVYIVSNGALNEIPPDRFPVGIYEGEQKPFTLHEINIKQGDMIYCITDGFEDQLGGSPPLSPPRGEEGNPYYGKKFKSKRLREILLSIALKSVDEQKEVLERTIDEWKGNNEQTDDITVIGIRV